MVHWGTGNHRLGIWDRDRGAGTEEGVLRASQKTSPGQLRLAASPVAARAVRLGNCLFVQWRPDARSLPRFVRQT